MVGGIAATQIARGETAKYDISEYDALNISGTLQPQNQWLQVRVQQRVIVRVPNLRRSSRQPLGLAARISQLPEKSNRLKEKKIGKCLWVNKLSAARPGSGKKQNLEFVTKSGGLIRAYLGDGCLAREFYAGAYMEKAKDGKLCIDRDIVRARTGAKCEISKFRELVASK